MKVADAIASVLVDHGIRHVFLVSGGGNLHLIKAISENKGIDYVCPQTETSAGYAADAYSRLRGIGCALSTSGPGATNLITAIATSYYDSLPVLYITGNVTRNRMPGHTGCRQIGFQWTPIAEIVKPITKYAQTLMEPSAVVKTLRFAILLAQAGRPGPVLCDIPDDVQRAEI